MPITRRRALALLGVSPIAAKAALATPAVETVLPLHLPSATISRVIAAMRGVVLPPAQPGLAFLIINNSADPIQVSGASSPITIGGGAGRIVADYGDGWELQGSKQKRLENEDGDV